MQTRPLGGQTASGHRTGNANWRLAVENGFDPGRVLIHRDNILILALGFRPITDDAIKSFEGDGPRA